MVIRIVLILFGVLGGVLLAEALVGVMYPQVSRTPPVWQFDPNLGWHHVPSGLGRHVTPEFDVSIAINPEGLRDRSYQLEREPQTRRILLFGDSFAEGWGVEVEQSVGEALESLLNRGRKASHEVINFGVAGYGTDQALLLFRLQGQHYAPDIVLILFYGNDLWNNVSRRGIGAEQGDKPVFVLRKGGLQLSGTPVRKSRYWEFLEGVLDVPMSYRFERYLAKHWHLYVLLRKILETPEVSSSQRRVFYEGLYGKAPNDRHARSWKLTGEILRLFDVEVKARGAQLVVVYVPSIVQIEDEDWRLKRDLHGMMGDDFDLLKPNRELSQIAAKAGIRFLDLYPHFRDASRDHDLYFSDSHWNPSGHRLAAQEINRFLEHEGLVDGAHSQ